MKNTKQIIFTLTGLALAGAAGSAGAAVIAVGTTFGIDMGSTVSDNSATIMNSIQPGVNSEAITAGTMLDTAGVVVDNVSATALSTGFTFANNDAATNAEIAGQPGIFNDSNLTDWFGLGPTGTAEIRITGLDDSFTYDLVIGHAFLDNGTNTNTLYSADQGNLQSAINQHDSTTGDTFVTLSGLQSVGGALTINIAAAPGSGAAAVSALTLTAVPEPSSSALLGLGALALILRRRK